MIKNARLFRELVDSIDWHEASLKDVQIAKMTSVTPRTVKCDAFINLARFLIVLPYEPFALEVVCFEIQTFTLQSGAPMEELGNEAVIQRRVAAADFEEFQVTGSCLAYQKIEQSRIGVQPFYDGTPIYGEDSQLLPPYDIDWRTELDMESANH